MYLCLLLLPKWVTEHCPSVEGTWDSIYLGICTFNGGAECVFIDANQPLLLNCKQSKIIFFLALRMTQKQKWPLFSPSFKNVSIRGP
mmetsp:Transcript_11015/g.14772  ORF Transcript_11015/g.14772 Transcript_11015/m.14772 type:complete len:87 (+) Transcript_11015:153-413(+)